MNIFDWSGEIVHTTRGHIFAWYVLGVFVGIAASKLDQIW
jgi:hypothetical protein